jgi:hypothetical protein
MGIVQIGPNGEIHVLEPGTSEELALAEEKFLDLVRALARQAARLEFARASDEARGASEAGGSD